LDLRGYETLTGLVERYSPTGGESAAVQWLVLRMRDLGFAEAHIDGAGNAVGVMGSGPRQGLLLGHIDTVRGEIPLRIEAEAFFGRGAVDAKGPLAAFVDAVAEVGPADGWQWIVVGAVDEEGDSRGARFLLDRYRPAFVIVGEPSRWDRVTIGYKGSAWSEATLRRPMAHSASPEASACEQAVAYWLAVQAWASEFNHDRPRAFDQTLDALQAHATVYHRLDPADAFDVLFTIQPMTPACAGRRHEIVLIFPGANAPGVHPAQVRHRANRIDGSTPVDNHQEPPPLAPVRCTPARSRAGPNPWSRRKA